MNIKLRFKSLHCVWTLNINARSPMYMYNVQFFVWDDIYSIESLQVHILTVSFFGSDTKNLMKNCWNGIHILFKTFWIPRGKRRYHYISYASPELNLSKPFKYGFYIVDGIQRGNPMPAKICYCKWLLNIIRYLNRRKWENDDLSSFFWYFVHFIHLDFKFRWTFVVDWTRNTPSKLLSLNTFVKVKKNNSDDDDDDHHNDRYPTFIPVNMTHFHSIIQRKMANKIQEAIQCIKVNVMQNKVRIIIMRVPTRTWIQKKFFILKCPTFITVAFSNVRRIKW